MVNVMTIMHFSLPISPAPPTAINLSFKVAAAAWDALHWWGHFRGFLGRIWEREKRSWVWIQEISMKAPKC